jgi:predicted NBD/HSP70 family sugar kinase
MLYLGIDQHARQITISLRDENGDVLQARQVSTRPDKINEFFERLTDSRGRIVRCRAGSLRLQRLADTHAT